MANNDSPDATKMKHACLHANNAPSSLPGFFLLPRSNCNIGPDGIGTDGGKALGDGLQGLTALTDLNLEYEIPPPLLSSSPA